MIERVGVQRGAFSVTIAHAGDQYTGIMVDRMDANVMKQEMTRILTRLYETMLLQGPIA